MHSSPSVALPLIQAYANRQVGSESGNAPRISTRGLSPEAAAAAVDKGGSTGGNEGFAEAP